MAKSLLAAGKLFELSNHLGNVLVTLSDKKLQVQNGTTGVVGYYNADVISATDYYPGGMDMPGRQYSSTNDYRYGFNGKEKAEEISSGDYDYGARIYDGRIGRWLSLDPLQAKYPNETHYGLVSNNPIIYMDVDGRDKILTLKLIGINGKSIITTTTEKEVYQYTKVSVKGFGNNRYYRQNILVNTTIDLRDNTITQSESLGVRDEVPAAEYDWFKIKEFFSYTESRGSQPGGMSLTSKFALEIDGPKRDATKGSYGSINVDLLMAAFTSLGKANSLKKIPNLEEWASLAKDIVEQAKQDSPTNSSSPENKKLKPIVKSTPEREGGGWLFYERDAKGKFKESGSMIGLPDSTVKGQNGAPDTIYKRPYKEPSIPKNNIKRKN